MALFVEVGGVGVDWGRHGGGKRMAGGGGKRGCESYEWSSLWLMAVGEGMAAGWSSEASEASDWAGGAERCRRAAGSP